VDTLISKRLARALVAVCAAAALASCTGGSGAAAKSPGRTVLPNSDADFDATFLAGTARENGAAPNTGDFAPVREQRDPVARKWVQISADPADPVNGPLRNAAGRTLYFFTDDQPFGDSSACDESCARQWPPVVVSSNGKVFVDRVPKSAIGHVVREDGLTQLTVSGHPIYRYAGDTGPDQTRGHGAEGRWFAVTPSGDRARVTTAGGSA
jgi:predicted lipoprotein with Yx(FWY)xxD motif